MTDRQTFRRHERLLRPADFERVFARRCSVRSGMLVVHGTENGLGFTRMGKAVGRRWGSAVARNRIKRMYREAFRTCKSQLPTGLDLVLIPTSSAPPTLASLQTQLPDLVRQLARKLQQRPPSAGGSPGPAASSPGS